VKNALLFLTAIAAPFLGRAAEYDPLTKPPFKAGQFTDLEVRAADSKRTIPFRVYLPEKEGASPMVLFSHGLGGSREGSAYLGRHWSSYGYAVVFVQHPGSDTSVWKQAPAAERMKAMKSAASAENFLLRVRDIPAVLDYLAAATKKEGDPLFGRLDLEHVGMSGHSFGAVTTQAVSGQRTARLGDKFRDARIDAAVIMSPSGPRAGSAAEAFGKVELPWLLMTGTKDLSLIGDIDLASRLSVYPALPAGQKYELVLHEAEHSAFTERALPGESGKRNPEHHKAILALSTAFWDAYLKDDAEAKAWLNGEGARAVLSKEDRWQRK
jgi:predicted dienelactone hydrolase